MYQQVTEHDFIDAFRQFDRLDTGDGTGGNFTPAGCRALFDYLSDLQDDTGEPIELDVIALCCDFAEYADADEAARELMDESQYAAMRADLARADGDEDDWHREVVEWLEEKTQVFEIPNSRGIIVQAF